MNRRQLLLRSAWIALLSPVVRTAEAGHFAADSAEPLGSNTAPPRLLVVQDPAYCRSREFAIGLQARGALQVSLEPDALTCWHHSLRKHCATDHTIRIAGLTTQSDYLVLRDSARTAGLATVARLDADEALARAGTARRRATLVAWVLAPAT